MKIYKSKKYLRRMIVAAIVQSMVLALILFSSQSELKPLIVALVFVPMLVMIVFNYFYLKNPFLTMNGDEIALNLIWKNFYAEDVIEIRFLNRDYLEFQKASEIHRVLGSAIEESDKDELLAWAKKKSNRSAIRNT